MIAQIGIALFGLAAVALTQIRNPRWQRWACFFGLAGQPFWFYASYTTQQWGIFALCFLYTACWCMGVWTYWLADYFGPRAKS